MRSRKSTLRLVMLLHLSSFFGGTGGRSPEGAGRVRETGEEWAGNGISTMAGSGREIQKASFRYFVTAYIQSKKRTQQRLLTSI